MTDMHLGIPIRVTCEIDLRPLEDLLEKLRAVGRQPERLAQPAPAELPAPKPHRTAVRKARRGPKRAPRAGKPGKAAARKPAKRERPLPFTIGKGAKTTLRPEASGNRVPGEGGRVTRCRSCDKPFRVTSPGPLPKDCPVCKAKPKAAAVEARAFSEDEPIGKKTA